MQYSESCVKKQIPDFFVYQSFWDVDFLKNKFFLLRFWWTFFCTRFRRYIKEFLIENFTTTQRLIFLLQINLKIVNTVWFSFPSLKTLSTIVMWYSNGSTEAVNWAYMIPRDDSLSNACRYAPKKTRSKIEAYELVIFTLWYPR